MKLLIDNQGRPWPLFIHDECIDRIEEATGVDLRTTDGQGIAGSNAVLFRDVTFAAWRSQCRERGITRGEFQRFDQAFREKMDRLFVTRLAQYLRRIGKLESAASLERALEQLPPMFDEEAFQYFRATASELNDINSERALDEKRAELHELLGEKQKRGLS